MTMTTMAADRQAEERAWSLYILALTGAWGPVADRMKGLYSQPVCGEGRFEDFHRRLDETLVSRHRDAKAAPRNGHALVTEALRSGGEHIPAVLAAAVLTEVKGYARKYGSDLGGKRAGGG